MSDASADPVPIASAATVVLLRDAAGGPEVLLVRRGQALVFHGGAWVFPGGRVDAEDRSPDSGEETAARRAAVRETREEAGVEVAADALVPVSHWTTPPGQKRRFATWVFAAAIDRDVGVVVDGGETSGHRWVRPHDALAARDRGELELPPPTFVTLATLVPARSAAGVLAEARAAEPTIFVPRLHATAGGGLSLYEGDAGYHDGDHGRPGARHRLHMLEDGWRYERSRS
jgi:8-oxo-dGTP pyrophosphatase MutT (NUDIX family)